MATSNSTNGPVSESVEAIDKGLTAIWGAATVVDADRLTVDEVIGVSHLIHREAYQLMIEFETVKKALGAGGAS